VAMAGNTKVVAFGSHRILGNCSSGSDLDLLCMVSSHVSRVEIFTHLPPLLTSRTDISDFLVRFALICMCRWLTLGFRPFLMLMCL